MAMRRQSLKPMVDNCFDIRPSIFANIFGWIRKSFNPNLTRTSCLDDAMCFNKNDSINYVISVWNNFHQSIEFTYETENKSSTSFLDIQLLWKYWKS